MTRRDIEAIRSLIADGCTDDEIAELLHDADEAERFEEDAYGIDDRSQDHWTPAQVEFHDRLSLGRNDAGEWLGFM